MKGLQCPHVTFRNSPVDCAHTGIKGLPGCDCHLRKRYTSLGRCSVRMSVVSLSREKLLIYNSYISLMESCASCACIHRRIDFVFYLIIRRNLCSVIKGRSLVQNSICQCCLTTICCFNFHPSSARYKVICKIWESMAEETV